MLRNNRLRSSIIQDIISDIGKIKPITREFNLNADKKRDWFSELRSLDDKTKCDSAATPTDIVANSISEEEID